MPHSTNPLLTTWPTPPARPHLGQFVTLTPSNIERDAPTLFSYSHGSPEALAIWRYMPYGPFADVREMAAWMSDWNSTPGNVAFTVSERISGSAVGSISLMRITPAHGCAELGSIWYAPTAQRTKTNTESVYLLLRHLFEDLRYRRAEWKCDDRNARSRAAALRLGFQYEGTFRQHMVIKGENRDTAWFGMVDADWPPRKANLESWLYTENPRPLSELNQIR